MPVEQPTGIQLCINLKIAKALGFTMAPRSLAGVCLTFARNAD